MALILLLLTLLVTSVQSLELVEYRIPLPVSVEEYKLAQLYRVAQESKANTGGGEGVEIITNEPFEDSSIVDRRGQYTHKIYHLASKVPKLVRMLAPKGSLEIHEKSRNTYPTVRTVLFNPDYMKDGFYIIINTVCKSGIIELKNVFNLDQTKLVLRKIKRIDIAADKFYDPNTAGDPQQDPTLFKSLKTGRGPLDKYHWKEKTSLYPLMTCYKLVEIEFKWFGLQKTIEKRLVKFYNRLFSDFNRRLFTTIDQWYDLTLADIRAIEEKTKRELDRMRSTAGEVHGYKIS